MLLKDFFETPHLRHRHFFPKRAMVHHIPILFGHESFKSWRKFHIIETHVLLSLFMTSSINAVVCVQPTAICSNRDRIYVKQQTPDIRIRNINTDSSGSHVTDKAHWFSPQVRMRRNHALNELPHPQVVFAWGFLIAKPDPCSAST